MTMTLVPPDVHPSLGQIALIQGVPKQENIKSNHYDDTSGETRTDLGGRSERSAPSPPPVKSKFKYFY